MLGCYLQKPEAEELVEHGFTARVLRAVQAIRSKEVSRLIKDARPKAKKLGTGAALGPQEALPSDSQGLQAERLDKPRQVPSTESTSQHEEKPTSQQKKGRVNAATASAAAATTASTSISSSVSEMKGKGLARQAPKGPPGLPSAGAAQDHGAAADGPAGSEQGGNWEEIEQTDLQARLRFMVPDSRQVFGVPDPSGKLEYGTVFFQPTIDEEATALKGFALVVSVLEVSLALDGCICKQLQLQEVW